MKEDTELLRANQAFLNRARIDTTAFCYAVDPNALVAEQGEVQLNPDGTVR